MSLEEVWQRIEALKRDLEELGAVVKVSERTRTQDKEMRSVISLTAIIRKELKEEADA